MTSERGARAVRLREILEQEEVIIARTDAKALGIEEVIARLVN